MPIDQNTHRKTKIFKTVIVNRIQQLNMKCETDVEDLDFQTKSAQSVHKMFHVYSIRNLKHCKWLAIEL